MREYLFGLQSTDVYIKIVLTTPHSNVLLPETLGRSNLISLALCGTKGLPFSRHRRHDEGAPEGRETPDALGRGEVLSG